MNETTLHKSVLLFSTLLSAGMVSAADHPTTADAGPIPGVVESANATDSQAQTRQAAIDRLHRGATNAVQEMTSAIDGFFVTEDFATFEDDRTRVRLRLNVDHLENHGWDVSPKIKLNLVLPGLKNRMRLVVNEGDEGGDENASPTDDEENDVALRWIGKQTKAQSLAFDLGLRLKSGNLDPFVRLNTGLKYGLTDTWQGQTSNRIYYYSKTKLRNDFRQYFDRPITDDLLFRARSRIQYFEENDYNPKIEQKFTIFQTIADQSALAYEALWRREAAEDSPFDDDEIIVPARRHYQKVAVQLRYRRSFLRDWLFFEIWPIVGWTEERDWEMSLAGRFRLEINLGRHGDLRLDE